MEQELKIDGSAGGPFVIEGAGETPADFGEEPGSVTFGGIAVSNLTHWSSRWVKGQLPVTAEHGAVIVTLPSGVVFKGVWPQPIKGAFTPPVKPEPPTEPAPKK